LCHYNLFDYLTGKEWDAIIPEGEILKIEEQERQQQLLELNLPPRSRKTASAPY
jgi:hypothetical protein